MNAPSPLQSWDSDGDLELNIDNLQERFEKKPWLQFVESDDEDTSFGFLDECTTPRLWERGPHPEPTPMSIIEAQLSSPDWSVVTTALIQLGLMYSVGSIGNGVEKDLKQAFDLFMKAHHQLHPRGSYKVGEFIYTRMTDHYPISDCEFYFNKAVDLFVKLTADEGHCFGDTEFQYMLNDFRNGLIKYAPFYEIVLAKQYQNKFLRDLVEWVRQRHRVPITQNIGQ